jgi:hypothetical protein
LAVVHICAEGPLDCIDVGAERIRGNLDPVRQPLGKIGHEGYGVRARSLADAECRNQLRLGIERNEGPHIAEAAAVILAGKASLLLADIGPNLIDLDAAARKLAHLFVHELRAAVANLDQQPHDRVAVRPGHPLGAADRIALDQAVNDLDAAGERYAVHR